jgi:glycosyltransferase A (GT-A) superfamily protein (DUF2064 family)
VTAGTRLVVLGKPPRYGAAKTRLAAEIGKGPACRMARAMMKDTWSSVSAWVSSQPDLDLVFAQSGQPEEYPALLPTPTIIRQGEGDLGRRMATLVAGGLSQRARVLLLGTDSPGLPDRHLAGAIAALDGADVVLGPHDDGGFWCLGVRGGPQALWGNTWLDDLDWEAEKRREQVEERLRRMGLRLAYAPTFGDINHAADLPRIQALLASERDRAPETLAEIERYGARLPEPLSVIVAALNESIGLDGSLDALRAQPGPIELIVADGGSSDRSADRAAAQSDVTVVVSGPGRGRQYAAGAGIASGDAFLFLHADARLPPDGTRLVREALAGGAEAGAFATHTVPDPRFPNRAGPLLRLADLRSRLTRHPWGDQAQFVTREAYEAVGGIKSLPIMESYDLSVRLAARKPLVRIRTPVQVSGRRLQLHPLRSLLLMRLIPPLYRLGVDPARLARLYGSGVP